MFNPNSESRADCRTICNSFNGDFPNAVKTKPNVVGHSFPEFQQLTMYISPTTPNQNKLFHITTLKSSAGVNELDRSRSKFYM